MPLERAGGQAQFIVHAPPGPDGPSRRWGRRVCAEAVARGVPVGGELDYLDEGTLAQALRARRPVG